MTLMDDMFDYAKRIEAMDDAGVDLAIVSLTCPSVYWGGKEVSVATACMMNDDMAEQQKTYSDRIRFFATLPWQYPDAAITELDRALVGCCQGICLCGISGMSLTDPSIASIWAAIDAKGLPVLLPRRSSCKEWTWKNIT